MHTESRVREMHPSVGDQAAGLYDDVSSEIKHEVRQIKANKEPVDPSQTDVVVRRHVLGLSIGTFVMIAVFLIVAIAAIVAFGPR